MLGCSVHHLGRWKGTEGVGLFGAIVRVGRNRRAGVGLEWGGTWAQLGAVRR